MYYLSLDSSITCPGLTLRFLVTFVSENDFTTLQLIAGDAKYFLVFTVAAAEPKSWQCRWLVEFLQTQTLMVVIVIWMHGINRCLLT